LATTSAFPVVPSIVETRKYPVIVRWWENVWEEFTPFFRFGTEIRHIVCTINAIESRRFWDPAGDQGPRPLTNEHAALKCVHTAIASLAPIGRGQVRWTVC
jgi:hypothetical protein